MKRHELDGVCMGGPGGELYRVFEPRWWQLSRVLWLFAALRFPWWWTRRGLPAPVLGKILITPHGEGDYLEVNAVRERLVRLTNVPPASRRRHDWN